MVCVLVRVTVEFMGSESIALTLTPIAQELKARNGHKNKKHKPENKGKLKRAVWRLFFDSYGVCPRKKNHIAIRLAGIKHVGR